MFRHVTDKEEFFVEINSFLKGFILHFKILLQQILLREGKFLIPYHDPDQNHECKKFIIAFLFRTSSEIYLYRTPFPFAKGQRSTSNR